MAKQTSQINIAFLTKGEGEVAKAFKRLRGETVRLNRDFNTLSKKSIAEVRREFQRLGAGQRNSINAMQAQRNALSGLRNMADVTSIEFKQLTADIARLDAQMRKAGAGTTGFKTDFVLRENIADVISAGLSWHNCFSFGNGIESNRIRDDFNQPFLTNGLKASTITQETYKQER